MAWYAICETASGRLISLGEADVAPVIVGATALTLAGAPDLQVQVWDEATRAFVARPAKVLVDRLQDLLSNPAYADFVTAYNALNAANKTRLRNMLIQLLGRRRWRASGEAVELD